MEDVMTGSTANTLYYNPVSTFNDGLLADMKSSNGDCIWPGDDEVRYRGGDSGPVAKLGIHR
jgi:hypothetical protein